MSLRRFSQEYPASAGLTITLADLANGAARASVAVSNATNKYQDALVHLHFKLAAGLPGSEYRVLVYAYGSEDGTRYTSPVTGVDEAITFRTPTTLALIGEVQVRDNTDQPTFVSLPLSVAQAFGWALPRKWGIVAVNRTGRAFDSTGCAAAYTGVYQGVK